MDKVRISDAVRLRQGVDITSLPLGAQEGFIISRVEGRTTLRELALATGIPDATLVDSVQLLVQLNVLMVDGGAAEAPAARPAEVDGDPYPLELTPELAAEPGDLAPEMRLKLAQVAWKVRRSTHYDVLGVKRTAGDSDIRKAYLERSREFHPDAFFRKQLGSFKPMLEQAFKAVKKASEVLSDPGARRAYDSSIPAERSTASHVDETWRADPRRQAEAEDRRLRKNPLLERVARAKRHIQRARELMDAKQWHLAQNELVLAAAQDSRHPELAPLQARVLEETRREKVGRVILKLEGLASMGSDEAEVAPLLKEMLEVDGLETAVLVRVGRTLFKAGLFKLARQPADRAGKQSPDDPNALALLVDLMERAELYLAAARHLDRLQQIQPTPERKQRLEELRKRADKK